MSKKITRAILRLRRLGALDTNVIEKLFAADDERSDNGWRTTESGKHYKINGKGDVVAGPPAMKGSNVNKPSSWSKGSGGWGSSGGAKSSGGASAVKAASKPKASGSKAPSKPGGFLSGWEAETKAKKDEKARSLAKEMGVKRSELPGAMREKLNSIAQRYKSYDPDHVGERKKLLEEWNNNVSNGEAAGLSHKEMSEIFQNPSVDLARKYDDKHAKSSGKMGEPPRGYDPGPALPKSTKTPELSPVYSVKSVSKRDEDALKKFSEAAGDPKKLTEFLDKQKPGTMMRDKERGYGVFEKQSDGSWNYTAPGFKTPIPMMAEEVQKELAARGNAAEAIQAIATPKKGGAGRKAFWDSVRAVSNIKPNAGDAYSGRRTSLNEALENGAGRKSAEDFPQEKGSASAEYTKTDISEDGVIHSAGVPKGKLKNGTGVTTISTDDILSPNPDKKVYNTLSEFSVRNGDGQLVLTPEREKLHQDIMEETFRDATPVPEGQQKVFTMLGGGSAAGKGTIQGMLPELFNQNSPVIDADEMKKRIPEYVDTAFSDDHEDAASLAHEESSALAKRAMQVAMANGYNCTLDGTGDGRIEGPGGLRDKIETARRNGYRVEGVYVTCPTDLAVKRNAARSTTDEYNRLVKEGAVRGIHKKVSRAFPEIAPLMDHVVLYDTNQPKGSKPKKIAECFRGQKIQVFDEKAYQAFLNKADE